MRWLCLLIAFSMIAMILAAGGAAAQANESANQSPLLDHESDLGAGVVLESHDWDSETGELELQLRNNRTQATVWIMPVVYEDESNAISTPEQLTIMPNERLNATFGPVPDRGGDPAVLVSTETWLPQDKSAWIETGESWISLAQTATWGIVLIAAISAFAGGFWGTLRVVRRRLDQSTERRQRQIR